MGVGPASILSELVPYKNGYHHRSPNFSHTHTDVVKLFVSLILGSMLVFWHFQGMVDFLNLPRPRSLKCKVFHLARAELRFLCRQAQPMSCLISSYAPNPS